MRRSLRFLWQFSAPNVAILACFAAVVTVGTGLSGGAQDPNNLFTTYFSLFPLMSIMILFLLSYALCTSNLNMAVSFGARREDFFYALQAIMLLYAMVVWGLQAVMGRIPALLGWSDLAHWDRMLGNGMGFFPFLLMCLTVFSMGCVCGLVYARSRIWGIIVLLVFVLLGVTTVVLQLFTANHWQTGVWGDLPFAATPMLAAFFVCCEVFLWRYIRRYCVR